jgi:hypothetical protein
MKITSKYALHCYILKRDSDVMDVNNVISQRARTIFAKVLCAVSSAQCNMAFSAEKDVLSVERHVKTKSFKTMHRDCSRPFECPVRAKSVMQ